MFFNRTFYFIMAVKLQCTFSLVGFQIYLKIFVQIFKDFLKDDPVQDCPNGMLAKTLLQSCTGSSSETTHNIRAILYRIALMPTLNFWIVNYTTLVTYEATPHPREMAQNGSKYWF